MKKLSEVLKEHNDSKQMINAIIHYLGGTESIEDIINNGADSGFSGFIYTKDCVKFWKKYKKDILKLLESVSDNLGQSAVTTVKDFEYIKNSNYTENEIAKALYGKYNQEYDYIYNTMAWFALEEVARWFEDE
jgi:1-aminocyclopropane-1-carboxylate deaminase/D-cysteine desulfhydrase-like pyridoxal-dependent ACC family enzyme